jgi:Large polyvalent protein-associated domain 7
MAKTNDNRIKSSARAGAAPKARAAEELENAIRAAKPRGPRQTRSRPAADPSPPSSRNRAKKAAPDTEQSVPREIAERFIGVGSKYYFPDGTPAFTDRGAKLTTPSENTEVIRSLVTIAQARGWDRITVTGTERFRKEAWFAAQRVGMTVRGYQPSEIEQAQLVRGLAERRAAGGRPDRRPDKDVQVGNAPSKRSRSRTSARDATQETQNARGTVFVGRLLDHGRDTYRHDPREQSSYYVRLQTKDGEREVWGVDLERAVRDSLSNARTGDEVTVRAVSREPVTVPKRQRDATGRVIGATSMTTHRNDWIVERSEFLAGREAAARTFRDPTISAQEAVKRHPELQGSYLKLQAVKLGAERDFKNAQERERLMARARVLIAQSIERGEPLEPVRLREPADKKQSREQALKREPERSR